MSYYYFYKDISLDKIYATNDLTSKQSISNYNVNSIPSLSYNTSNGSVSTQNQLGFYNKLLEFSNLSAYYIDYTSNNITLGLSTLISVTGKEKQICVLLCGAGGSGGAGGGDKKGYTGANGAGGGGGGYAYYVINDSTAISGSYFNLSITLGVGGSSVSGGSGDNDNGKNGNSGGDTKLTFYDGTNYQTVTAYGGGYGSGGGSSTAGSVGVGGGVSTGSTPISNGSNGENTATYTSDLGYICLGGNSGFTNHQSNINFNTYPNISGSFGNGGYGTIGANDPNGSLTGAGGGGFARVYFKY